MTRQGRSQNRGCGSNLSAPTLPRACSWAIRLLPGDDIRPNKLTKPSQYLRGQAHGRLTACPFFLDHYIKNCHHLGLECDLAHILGHSLPFGGLLERKWRRASTTPRCTACASRTTRTLACVPYGVEAVLLMGGAGHPGTLEAFDGSRSTAQCPYGCASRRAAQGSMVPLQWGEVVYL